MPILYVVEWKGSRGNGLRKLRPRDAIGKAGGTPGAKGIVPRFLEGSPAREPVEVRDVIVDFCKQLWYHLEEPKAGRRV